MYPTTSGAPTYASLGLTSHPLRKTPHVTGRFCRDYFYHQAEIRTVLVSPEVLPQHCPQKRSTYVLWLSHSLPLVG